VVDGRWKVEGSEFQHKLIDWRKAEGRWELGKWPLAAIDDQRVTRGELVVDTLVLMRM